MIVGVVSLGRYHGWWQEKLWIILIQGWAETESKIEFKGENPRQHSNVKMK